MMIGRRRCRVIWLWPPGLVGLLLCHTVAQEPALEKGPYRVTSSPSRTIDVVIQHELPPTNGVVIFPVPPNTSSQRVTACEMTVRAGKRVVRATPTTDLGPLKKPILVAALPGREGGQAVVKLELELSAAKLEPGKAEKLPAPLARADRAAHLEAEWHYEYGEKSFGKWMGDQKLVRGKTESDRDFSLRVLNFLRQQFVYKIPDPEVMRKRVAERGTGDLGYFVDEKAAECWGLSRIYTSVLRANNIPCRQLSGFVLADGDEPRGGHHVRAEVYLDGIGWILVEVAGAVTGKDHSLLRFFGHAGDDMVLISRGVNYRLLGPKGPGSIGTFSGFAIGTAEGKWEFPHGKWEVTTRK
jgi:hypothetical protein